MKNFRNETTARKEEEKIIKQGKQGKQKNKKSKIDKIQKTNNKIQSLGNKKLRKRKHIKKFKSILNRAKEKKKKYGGNMKKN